MRTHVALLRGINVGGHNKVAMADLREVVASLGHSDVATYIQSGNVVFTSRTSDTTELADSLEREIAERMGVRAGVVVLSRDELARVVGDNPYPREANPQHLHAVFHRDALTADQVAVVADAEQRARDRGSQDEVAVLGRIVYLHTPDGLGRSELAVQLARPAAAKALQPPGTARNWATVAKLTELLTPDAP